MHHGIVLLFDENTSHHAFRLNRKYRHLAVDPGFTLGTHHNLPHLSLLHLELDDAGVGKARETLVEVSQALGGRGLDGSFGSIRAFGTWCWWQTPYTPLLLLELHHRAVDLCAPLRLGPLRDPPQEMSAAQERMYREHGCWFVKDAWNPHLTLQVLRPEYAGLNGGEAFQPWRATSIALARMGKFGSAQDIVARVNV